MPYVYKYTDRNDNVVKYVGIIKKESNFPKRFEQHKSDNWNGLGDWLIEYCYVESQTDAEMLESHFITKYGTYKWYNKAKTDWGLCSFFNSELNWKEYNFYSSGGCCNYDRYEQLSMRLYEIQRELEKIENDIEHYRKDFLCSIKEKQVLWIHKNLVDLDPYFTYELSIKEAYDDFIDFVENTEGWSFPDSSLSIEEWIEHLCERKFMYGRIKKRNNDYVILNVFLKNNPNFKTVEKRLSEKRMESLPVFNILEGGVM